MEAIILAAGMGSRLGPRSLGLPKALITVGGETIVQRQLRALRAVGVTRVVIVTGFEAERLRAATAGPGVEFMHNPRFRETNVLVSWALGATALSDDHIYVHGDTVFELELLHRLLCGGPSGVLLTVDRRECGDEEMKVQVQDRQVVAIGKNLTTERTTGEFTGVMLARGRMLPVLREAAEALIDEGHGELAFFEAALQHIVRDRPSEVGWVDVTGLKWREIDFPEDLDAAERLFGG